MNAPRSKTTPGSRVTAKLSMGDFGISDLWEIAHRRWLSISFCLAVFWGLGAFYFLNATKIYESRSEVLVMRKDTALTQGMVAKNNGEAEVSEDLLATHMQIIRSKLIVEKALASDGSAIVVSTMNATNESPDGATAEVSTKPDSVSEAAPSIPIAEAVTAPNETGTTADETVAAPPKPRLADLPSIVANLDRDFVTGEIDQTPTQYVIDNLEVTRGGNGQARQAHTITIAFQHPDARDAQTVLNAIVFEYQKFLSEKFQDVNKIAAELIENASSDLKQKLDLAESDYRTFKERSPLLTNGENGTNIFRMHFEDTQRELSNVQLSLTQARSRLATTEQQFADVIRRPNASSLEFYALIDQDNAERLAKLIEVELLKSEKNPQTLFEMQLKIMEKAQGNQAEIKTLYENLSTMMATLASLEARNGKQSPEVKSQQAAIDSYKKFIDEKNEERRQEQLKDPGIAQSTADYNAVLKTLEPKAVMESYLSMMRSDVRSLERREQALAEAASATEEEAKALIVYELEADNLRQEVVRAEALYTAVLDRLREINLAKDYSGFVNEVMESPEVGETVWPNLPIVLVLSTLLGLIAGAGLAGLREYGDRSFRDPEEVRRELDLPILTHVPQLGGRREAVVEGSKIDPSVSAYHRPKSREAEVFRGLRTSLFFSSNGRKCQVVAFTSPNQGDGKSTVLGNLAVSIAQSGRRVLLIDCDLRRPNVHRLLGLKNETGLTDVIVGDVEPWDAIQQTETTNLWAMPSGPLPANPAELLTSETFEQFLALAREKFEYVLLDCPPVLAVADPCIVAPRADGVALVLRVAKDSRPQAVRAKEMLARVGANVLGVVVNASKEASRMGYGKFGDSAFAQAYDYGNGSQNSKYYQSDDEARRSVDGAARR